jgi:aldehyde:ferredoxin oxidoreductase
MYGWIGKILNVDLTTCRTTELETKAYADKYIGGRGIASRIYWEKVPPEVKAFDSENYLIFMTGPLVATGAQGASRMAVVGKSPTTFPEGYCYGNIGGFAGAELKKAGYDGVVITGRAHKPVYLWIKDGQVEFRDASLIWGKGAYWTEQFLHQKHGNDVRYLTTGVAGENKVRTAISFASHQSASTGGFGAVMGAKNLKAVAIKGNGKPEVADPEALREISRHTVKLNTRFGSTISPQIRATGKTHLPEVIGQGNCYLCRLDCPRRLMRYGKRLEGYRKCQSMEYYLPWKYAHDDEPLETFFDAPTLANDYSIETYELQAIVEWLHACYRTGCLSEAETGLPLSRIGTRGFLEKLLHSIAYREGFGDILAEGLMRAKEKVPTSARVLVNPLQSSIGHYDVMPSRALVAHALLYSMEPRKHPISVHEIIYVILQWRANQVNPQVSPVTSDVFREIAKTFWGSKEAADLSSYSGKALAAKNIQDHTYIRDSLGLCDFIFPNTFSFNTANFVGDPELEAKTFTTVTGVNKEAISGATEPIFNLQRAILIREGRQVPGDDYPPSYNFLEPLPVDPARPFMIPGPDGSPVNAAGMVLDPKKFEQMLQEYHSLRGWDNEGKLKDSSRL